MRAAIRVQLAAGIERAPNLRFFRIVEAFGHHARNGVRLGVHLNRFSHDIAPSAVAALPERVAQYGDAIVPAGSVVFGSDHPAEEGL